MWGLRSGLKANSMNKQNKNQTCTEGWEWGTKSSGAASLFRTGPACGWAGTAATIPKAQAGAHKQIPCTCRGKIRNNAINVGTGDSNLVGIRCWPEIVTVAGRTESS